MASTDFINECKNRANANRLGQLIVDGIETPISNKNNLQKISIDDSCYVDGNIIGSVFVKKLTAEFIGIEDNNQLVDKQLYAQIGVKYADNSTEYVDMGNYTIERPKDEKTANYSQITAYDSLAENIDKKYVCGIDYSQGNITVSNLYQDVCRQLGLSPKTLTFLNSNIPISNNPFVNGETNRTVLQSIGKVACSFFTIDIETNKIDLSWLSENEEPDYEFAENDYAILDGGIVSYGPINSVTIKNSVIDDENVTQTDQNSITTNGEHSLIINEDYILYNAELRQQAITAIFNRLNGLKYVDCKLTTYYGKPFLKIGSKIRINSKGSYFDTYVLKHNFTYDGTFTSVIESPVLTEQQVKNKQEMTLQKKLTNTQIIVDKQNQKIQSVVEQTDAQNQKINKVTQTVEELNSKISDIADITTSGEDNDAQVELNNINKSEPIRLVVRPIEENISYLYPSDNLYPSDDLFLKVRTIRFHNKKTDEDFDYELPDDLLYYDNENYDEFVLDYDGQSCVINKKVGYNADGTTYVLDKPTTVEYPYPKIVLSEGDYDVYILSYSQGYIFARLMAQNIYTTQFYTKAEVDSEFIQQANKMSAEVNQKLKNYSTTSETNAKIEEKITESEASITSSISKKYATKEETKQLDNKIEQRITDEVNEINLEVSKKVNDKDYTGANIILKINGDTSGAQIDADVIKLNANDILNLLAGNSINLTTKNITIEATNFSVDKNGNVTAINIKAINGSFSGVINGSTISGSTFKGNGDGVKLQIGSDSNGFLKSNNSLELLYESDNSKILGIYARQWNMEVLKAVYFSSKSFMYKFITESTEGFPCEVGSEVFSATLRMRSPEYVNTSSEKLKKNIKSYSNGLNIIKDTDIYEYNYKDEKNKHKKHLGVVIGEKYKTPKEIISEDEEGVDLYSMISVAWQAIKEQQEQIELLKKEIELLKNKESDK